jgi:hypothetical protein
MPRRYQDNAAGWLTHRRDPVTIANPTIPPVPVPAGVEHVSEWNDAARTPNRILHGPNRGVERLEQVVVANC